MVLMRTGDRSPGDSAGQRRRCEPLLKLPARVSAEGAEHQVAGCSLSRKQEVDGPELDAEGLARPGPGDDQQRPIRVADDLSLLGIQLRVQAQYDWCNVHCSLVCDGLPASIVALHFKRGRGNDPAVAPAAGPAATRRARGGPVLGPGAAGNAG